MAGHISEGALRELEALKGPKGPDFVGAMLQAISDALDELEREPRPPGTIVVRLDVSDGDVAWRAIVRHTSLFTESFVVTGVCDAEELVKRASNS